MPNKTGNKDFVQNQVFQLCKERSIAVLSLWFYFP